MNGKRAAIIASLFAVLLVGAVAGVLVLRARSLALEAGPSVVPAPAGETPAPSETPAPGGSTEKPDGILPVEKDAPRALEDAALADVDRDGLTATEEFQAGSDASKADTDGDGLSDFEEVRFYCTDPRLVRTDGATPDAEWVARRMADAQAAGQRAAFCVQ